jgi:hypothetical protein
MEDCVHSHTVWSVSEKGQSYLFVS